MRITEQERARFHALLDECIDKMNSDKNKEKSHWSGLSNTEIVYNIRVEVAEAELSLVAGWGLREELKDIINFALFGMDND